METSKEPQIQHKTGSENYPVVRAESEEKASPFSGSNISVLQRHSISCSRVGSDLRSSSSDVQLLDINVGKLFFGERHGERIP